MQIIHSVQQLRTVLNNRANNLPTVGVVPSMGNLHPGHIKLIEIAKQHAEYIVVSIFVNPLQFGVNEDFGRYPRTLVADCEKLQAAGTDIVFAPNVAEIYTNFDGQNLNQTMSIALPPIANELCGAIRPGHFSGVATVVAKLFNIIQPDVAVFGKKDFQQLFIIRELVKQFNFPIKIVAGETVRETSGLAMSSRNGFLTDVERAKAKQLNQALSLIATGIEAGNHDYNKLEQQAIDTLISQNWVVDYISVRSSLTLLPANNSDIHLVVLGAAKLGNTRLIDNIELSI